LDITGELQREDGQQPEIVAVKVLKETATREAEEDFMREVDIMSAFRHCNILSLIGVVLRGKTSVVHMCCVVILTASLKDQTLYTRPFSRM
jgi:serine/threonine protein kinase